MKNSNYDFNIINDQFQNNMCWGLSTAIDSRKCNPAYIRDAKKIESYVIELCELIKVKRFQEVKIVNFGEDERIAGFSMVQLIETSLISGHFVNLTNSTYIDIFSCKVYDPKVAVQFTQEFFEAKVTTHTITLRK